MARSPAPAPVATPAADGEQLLWESPTAGARLKLHYLPPAAQAIVAWRPAQTLASAEGRAAIEGLGPGFQQWLSACESRLGMPLDQVDQLLIGLLDGTLTDAGLSPPRISLVAWCKEPIDTQSRIAKWNQPKSREEGGQTYYEVAGDTRFVPHEESGHCLVVLPQSEFADVAELAGAAPQVRSELEAVLAESDSDRLLTIALVPSFLSTGGKQLFAQELAPVRAAIEWLLADQVQSALLSVHLDENLFLEARFLAKPDIAPAALEAGLDTRVRESTARLNQFLTAGQATPYGQPVLERFPRMWELLVAETRSARQSRQVILRTCLPGVAAHNFAYAGRLALTEIVPGGDAAAEVAGAQASLPAATIAERLDRPLQLGFPRQTLEEAIALFEREAGIRVEILGQDLQLEGITKNQSFDLPAANLPARRVLEMILRRASAEGKLVYVERPAPDTKEPMLVITTRSAAAKRGEGAFDGTPD